MEDRAAVISAVNISGEALLLDACMRTALVEETDLADNAVNFH